MAREEKRREILKAASRVFYVRGFEGTKMEDVAKEAGIGKGTVYEYFESKQQLFEEMVAYNGELHIQGIKNTLDTGRTFQEKFLALAKYQTRLVKDHIGVFENMACSKIMAREMGALFLEQNERVLEIIKDMVMEAAQTGELRPDVDPEIVASVISGTINQYCGKRILFYHVQPEEINYHEVVDTVLQGIRAR